MWSHKLYLGKPCLLTVERFGTKLTSGHFCVTHPVSTPLLDKTLLEFLFKLANHKLLQIMEKIIV